MTHEEEKHGPYTVAFCWGKWRVTLGSSSGKYLLTTADKEPAVSFAKRMAATHDKNGRYIVTEADRGQQQRNREVFEEETRRRKAAEPVRRRA